MLVTHVLGDCPGCGAKDSFGNVSVHDVVLRGCMHCKYESMVLLPTIKKRVIYLDQFFFSGALRGKDARFQLAAELVRRICRLQLLVAPYSSVHEDEAHQWRGYRGMTSEQLMAFIREVSRGVEFEKDYSVEHTQILKAWEAFQKGRPPKYIRETQDAIQGSIDEWDDYYRVDVAGYFRNIELKRQFREESVDELVKVLDVWQSSKESFEDAIALELLDSGKNYLETYLTMLRQYAEGDASAVLNTPLTATVVEKMMHWLPADLPLSDRLRRCTEFFQSQHFAEVPHEWLSSHMFATMKAMVKRGVFANRESARKHIRGLFGDIRHISLYAPYCDAIVVDKFMADLVKRPTVGLEQRYGVKVFSLSSWDDLLAWLDNLETGMDEDHRIGVAAAYPGAFEKVP